MKTHSLFGHTGRFRTALAAAAVIGLATASTAMAASTSTDTKAHLATSTVVQAQNESYTSVGAGVSGLPYIKSADHLKAASAVFDRSGALPGVTTKGAIDKLMLGYDASGETSKVIKIGDPKSGVGGDKVGDLKGGESSGTKAYGLIANASDLTGTSEHLGKLRSPLDMASLDDSTSTHDAYIKGFMVADLDSHSAVFDPQGTRHAASATLAS